MEDIYNNKACTHTDGVCPLANVSGDLGHLHYTIHQPLPLPTQSLQPNKIIAVMGFATDGAIWFNTVDYFTNKGFTVLTFDNRGCGQSSDPLSYFGLSIYGMSQDALTLLDYLGWATTSTHLIGTSMGGMISQELLAQRHFLSASLVLTTRSSAAWFPMSGVAFLVRTGLWYLFQTWRTIFNPHSILYARSTNTAVAMNFSRTWLNQRSGFDHPTTNAPMTNETYLAMTSDKIWWAKKNKGKNPTPPLIGMVAQMYACATHDIDAQKMATIKARNVPTLVVGALHDKMIKYERSKELAKELNPVDFVTLNSGHTVIECHLELNQAVERLLNHAENGENRSGMGSSSSSSGGGSSSSGSSGSSCCALQVEECGPSGDDDSNNCQPLMQSSL